MPTTSMLDLSNARIAVRDSGGDGVPLVLIHGSGTASDVFANQMSGPLAESHRIISFDLPGHGASSNAAAPAQDYTLRGLANTTTAVLDALGLDRVSLYGWSLGGHIALELMDRDPGRLTGVMISGAPPVGHGALSLLRGFRARWDMLLASKETFSTHEADRFERLCLGSAADGTFLPTILRADGRMRPIVNRSMMRGEGADQRRIVEASPLPLAVVAGAEDPIPRLSYLAGLDYANLWEGQVHVIADTAHAPFLEAPNAFNALLHRFASHLELGERVRATPQEWSRMETAPKSGTGTERGAA